MTKQHFALAIHGGAGTILKSRMTAEKEQNYTNALEAALAAGYQILKAGGSSLDAVEAAVTSMEDSDLFNAGRGSVFSAAGTHEMEASIMCGKTLEAGAIAGVKHTKNPIQLSRKVMEDTEYVYLAGEGAEQFAQSIGMPQEDAAYFYSEYRYKQWQRMLGKEQMILDHSDDRKFGTVGAVALDVNGNVAAATSTGGLTNKQFGRIGDSSVIGSGTYANNNTCAISCTGYGEFFLRGVVAYDISCLMEYKGLSLQQAAEHVIKEKQVKLGGEGGIIGVDALGNVSLVFNSEGMYRGQVSSDDPQFNIGIFQ
ncbi:MAG: isoaspartyl peptidase/L-asparaginase family protein [Flammeovirgaceae bacterium]